MRLYLFISCVTLLYLAGCSPYEKLNTYESGGGCPATIEDKKDAVPD